MTHNTGRVYTDIKSKHELFPLERQWKQRGRELALGLTEDQHRYSGAGWRPAPREAAPSLAVGERATPPMAASHPPTPLRQRAARVHPNLSFRTPGKTKGTPPPGARAPSKTAANPYNPHLNSWRLEKLSWLLLTRSQMGNNTCPCLPLAADDSSAVSHLSTVLSVVASYIHNFTTRCSTSR